YALTNEAAMKETLRGKAWYRILAGLSHIFRPNTRKGAKRNISAHYDLGNAFYEKWLDRSMTYSAALFDEDGANQPLEQAQWRKYDNLAKQLGLKAGMHVLEVGCGWGGFAEHAARQYGAKVTAITISREQFDYATQRMKREGLEHLVEIRFQDYRDVTEQFDAIASIEMFEAVGEAYWPQFFGQIRERLKPGGRAAMQIITIEDERYDHYRLRADYIQKYIFPGGMLPSPTVLASQIKQAGLRLDEEVKFGRSYAETLNRWQDCFQARWPEIKTMGFDGRFKRMWEQYLAYCQAGFQTGAIDVVQVAVVHD
ncbi:MAG: cyclopropane-fatty-acyl-phospholipid synthase family protein, partial [Pseudomonadota bacterium]